VLSSEKATLGVAQRTTFCRLFGDSGFFCVEPKWKIKQSLANAENRALQLLAMVSPYGNYATKDADIDKKFGDVPLGLDYRLQITQRRL